MSRSILIASGKGGVGKSVFTANLGAALADRNASVVIIDADIGLRSQDAFLGLENLVVYDLIDVADKDCSLDDALLESPFSRNLKLLPAAQFARVKDLDSGRLRKILKSLKKMYDFILIDAPAGVEKGLRNLLNAGTDEAILIVTPDDICIRDAEKTARIFEGKDLPRPHLVVNRLNNELVARGEMFSARIVADTLDLPLIGEIQEDPAVYRSLLRHRLFLEFDCPARSAVMRIAARLLGSTVPLPEIGKNRIPLLRRLFPSTIKEVIPLDRH